MKENDDICKDLGCGGDDFQELIEEYARKFKVDRSAYLWYLHAGEEGRWNSIGSLFFKPPYKKVEHIPVTPQLLLEFANAGKWGMNYPEHRLSKRRYDMLMNQLVVGLLIIYHFTHGLKSDKDRSCCEQIGLKSTSPTKKPFPPKTGIAATAATSPLHPLTKHQIQCSRFSTRIPSKLPSGSLP